MNFPPPLLVFAFCAPLVACKAAPETAPPGASAPTADATPSAAPPAATSTEARPPPAATAGPRTYADSTPSIQAAPGEHFSVALPANITVPMKWRLEPAPDAKVLAVGEEKYVEQPPADCSGCTGYGGTRVFSFTATSSGKATLHFTLRPLTDPHGPSQKDVTVAVEVN